MIVCGNCGHKNDASDAFCGNCGQFLEWVGKPEGEAEAAEPESPTSDRVQVIEPEPGS